MPRGNKHDTITIPDETLREILHSPEVVAELTQAADKIVAAVDSMTGTEENFGVTLQNWSPTRSSRARALVHPITSKGIHLEVKESLLIKARAAF